MGALVTVPSARNATAQCQGVVYVVVVCSRLTEILFSPTDWWMLRRRCAEKLALTATANACQCTD